VLETKFVKAAKPGAVVGECSQRPRSIVVNPCVRGYLIFGGRCPSFFAPFDPDEYKKGKSLMGSVEEVFVLVSRIVPRAS
jgi:hypothetical protein